MALMYTRRIIRPRCTEITVTGEFRACEENGNLYCHLTAAKIE